MSKLLKKILNVIYSLGTRAEICQFFLLVKKSILKLSKSDIATQYLEEFKHEPILPAPQSCFLVKISLGRQNIALLKQKGQTKQTA